MMESKAFCTICLDDKPISDFRILFCGHAACNICLAGFFGSQKRKPCFSCRQSVAKSDAHPVFIQLRDFPLEVAHGIGQLSYQSSAQEVEGAAQSAEHAAAQLGPEHAMASTLSQAIEDLKQRIIPLFAVVEQQAADMKALDEIRDKEKRRMAEFEAKLASEQAALRKGVNEAKDLRKRLRDALNSQEQAFAIAEEANKEAMRVKGELELSQNAVGKANAEAKRYKGMLQARSEEARKEKEKRDNLEAQIASLRAQLSVQTRWERTQTQLEAAGSELSVYHAADTVPDDIQRFPLSVVHRNDESVIKPGFGGANWNLPRTSTKRKICTVLSAKDSDKPSAVRLNGGKPVGLVELGPKSTRKIPRTVH